MFMESETKEKTAELIELTVVFSSDRYLIKHDSSSQKEDLIIVVAFSLPGTPWLLYLLVQSDAVLLSIQCSAATHF